MASQWINGFELMRQLGATRYYVQPAGYKGGQARGRAVYENGTRKVERDAIEVCPGGWTRGGKVEWYVAAVDENG